jgi:hypothetical protein
MKPKPAVFAFVFLLGACGEAVPGSSTSLPSRSTTITVEPTTTLAGNGVAVIITATPVQQADGSIELCPPGMTGVCPGIVLEGDIDPDLISSEESPTVVQVSGTYDGRALYATEEPMAVVYSPIEKYEFDSLCPELQGTGTGQEPEIEAVSAYADAQPDFAASWWDRKTSIFTVWFKGGEISAHQEAIAEIAGDNPVCVAGNARFSQAELMEASQVITGFTDSRGIPLAAVGYSVGGLSNRIDLPLEAIDPETRAALTDLVGDRIVPYPFLDLVDVPLADLPEPVPVIAGDVDILTSGTRWGGGMAALGLFHLHYDPELNCIYGADPREPGRSVPVWPFGYAATSSPFTIYDYDGVPLEMEGDYLELGGGGVGLDGVEGNTCGADSAWIVNR